MKIRTMLIMAIAANIIMLSTVFVLIITINTRKEGERQFNEFIVSVAENQITNLKSYFDSYSLTQKNIADNYYIATYLQKGNLSDTSSAEYLNAFDVLKAYSVEGTNIRGLALISNSDGRILLSSEESFISPTLADSLIEAPENAFLCGNSPLDYSESVFYLYSKTKVEDDISLITAHYIEDIQKLIKYTAFNPNGRTILIDPEKVLIDTAFIGSLDISFAAEYYEFKERLSKSDYSLTEERFNYEIGKSNRSAYLKQVGDTGWWAAALVESERAHYYSDGVSAVICNVALVMSFILIGLNILCVYLFLKPLYVINSTLNTIKKGNFEARINIVSNNEYGKIANEFNELLDNVIVSEGRYRTIVEMSDNIIFEWNFITQQVSFSHNFNKKFSYRAPSDHFEDSFLVKCKVHPDDVKRYNADLADMAKGITFKRNEYRWKNIYGDFVWVLMRTAVITDRKGDVVKVVGVIVDIDRAKKSEKILTTRASYDALTGLFNRETVESLINNEIELLNVRKNQFSILFIDVDDFKFFNDNYSHATGDQVLKFTAATINEAVSNFGIAGRFGGDEFVVCIRNSDVNDPSKVAQEILDNLKKGFVCDGKNELSVNVSIGIAIIRDSSKRVEEIIGMADDAMYSIKKSGKSNYGFINT